ncbi:BRO family protein [Clostridium gasigenes]|uniref:BRO family, N-terminal domain n=1 Tax=Clostridium gasigenes TaxID=94869 RepID=A0A1H0N5A3_9CLOT|nr:BRO family protein [Clostridium gasigenes]SDO87686.1 BRO family, N-terminal domain [Clostridium gasigenes]
MIKLLQEKNIRMIWSNDGNEIWFSANDIGEELGVINIRNVLPNIDSEFKMKFKEQDISGVHKTYSRNFKELLNNFGEMFLTEEAVYQISFRSNKPEAKLFTKWVSKVLKQIRIHGYYIATEKYEQWFGARKDSKTTRKEFTDEVQEFVHYAINQGSNKPNMYYMHFTKLVNDKLGIPKGTNREDLDQKTLMDIMALERVMAMKLPKLIDKETNYKEAYKEIKKLIEII